MFRSLFNVGIFAIVQFVLSVLLNFYLSKILGPEEFGAYFYVLSTTQLISTVFIFGLTSSVIRYYEHILDRFAIEKYLRNILAIIGILYVLFVFISSIFSLDKYIFGSNSDLYWWVVIIQIPFVIDNLICTSFYWAKNDFFKRGIFTNIFNFFQVIFVVLLYYDIISINVFYSLVIARIINSLFLVYYIRKDFKLNFHLPQISFTVLKEERFRAFVKFGVWAALSTLSILIIDFVDRFVINRYLNSSDLGFYQSTVSIFSYFFMPFQLLANVLLSQFLKEWETNRTNVINKIQNLTIFSVFLYILVSITFIVNNEIIITTFFSESFLSFSKSELLLFCLVFLVKIIYSLTGCLSFISNKPQFLTKALLVSTFISIVLDFVLVQFLYLKGVLVSSIISYIFLLVILYYQYYREMIKFKGYYYLVIGGFLSLIIWLKFNI